MKKHFEIMVGCVEDNTRYLNHLVDNLQKLDCVKKIYTWTNAEECLEDEHLDELDVIFLDIHLELMSGVELARILTLKHPKIKKLMVTTLESEEMILKAIRNGALGYILKSEMENLESTLHTIMEGGAIITPTIAFKILNEIKDPAIKSNPVELTEKENGVLSHLKTGLTINKVAMKMDMSEHTVKYHVKNIYRKYSVNSRAELIKKLYEN